MRLPIRVSRVAKGGKLRAIYIPIEAEKLLGLTAGKRIMIYVDIDNKELIIKPVDIDEAKPLE